MCAGPVSYTHLDVYKRQQLPRTEWQVIDSNDTYYRFDSQLTITTNWPLSKHRFYTQPVRGSKRPDCRICRAPYVSYLRTVKQYDHVWLAA